MVVMLLISFWIGGEASFVPNSVGVAAYHTSTGGLVEVVFLLTACTCISGASLSMLFRLDTDTMVLNSTTLTKFARKLWLIPLWRFLSSSD